MNVAENDADPFCRKKSDCPLQNFEEVYMVTNHVQHPRPTAFDAVPTARPVPKPFETTEDCKGTDRSMNTCTH